MSYRWESELPALAALSDQAAAEAINAMTETVPQPITSSQMLAWLGGNGRYQRLQTLADTEAASGATSDQIAQSNAVRSIAKVALLMLQRPDTTIDFTHPDQVAMFTGLQQAGAMSADEATELQAMGTLPGQQKYPWALAGQVAEARKALQL
jgi:hypothetical protein